MEWNAGKFNETCGRVTEHGMNLVDALKQAVYGNAVNSRCRGTVLDLGCGTGVLTNEIAGFAAKVIGIDSSAAMIKKASEDYPDIEFHVMDGRALIWRDHFDAVFSNAVFHFIMDQDALLYSVHNALRSGGALVCEFGASGNIASLLQTVAEACVKRGRDYTLRFYYPSADEYDDLLNRHGFIVESITVYDLDTKLKEGWEALRNWIAQIFSIEIGWFDNAEKESVFAEIESALKSAQWDGACWHLPNRRIRVFARKQ